MKPSSMFGKGSGKLAGTVFVVRNGQQIVREYQPVVANPKSAAQTEQRAMFKLSQQVAASLAGFVFPYGRVLGQSSRNLFVRRLFADGALTFNDVESRAEVNASAIILSPSAVGFGGTVNAPTASGNNVTASFNPIESFKKSGATLVVAVLYTSSAYGVEVIGSTEVNVNLSGPTAVEVPCLFNPAGGRMVAFWTRVDESKLTDAYRNKQGVSADNISFVKYIRGEVPSAVLYSSSQNMEIVTGA